MAADPLTTSLLIDSRNDKHRMNLAVTSAGWGENKKLPSYSECCTVGSRKEGLINNVQINELKRVHERYLLGSAEFRRGDTKAKHSYTSRHNEMIFGL